MLVNTREFSRDAQHFIKHGHYIDAPAGTPEYYDYWDEQRERCLEGYTIGDTTITGYHYFYLNFSQILRVDDKAMESVEATSAEKLQTFPAFWDGDYHFFNAVDKARKIGRHLVVVKARGKGFSYKTGSMLARNFHLKRRSKNYGMAYEKEFLTKDGLLTKAHDNSSFIDNHTAWFQPQIKSLDMHRMSGYYQIVEGQRKTKGTLNQLIGITLKDDPDRARGKRGELALFEEAGKLPGLLKAWQVCRPSYEQGPFTTGLMIAFGTGGADESDFSGMEELFYNPDAYRVLPFENIWDEGAEGTKCSFFFPAYTNFEGYMDKDGNTQEEEAKEYLNEQRENMKGTKDANALDQFICEFPFNPREAMLRVNSNIFPVYDLNIQLNQVQATKKYNMMTPGILHYEGSQVKFKPSADVKPVLKYPHKRNDRIDGAVTILEAPFKHQGETPKGMYIICHDPYAKDQSTTNESLGSAYVIKRTNNMSHSLNNCIVASYVGRPSTQDEYNRNLFMLAQYYNAKIGFENNRGSVADYAKRFRKLEYLERQFDIMDKGQSKQGVNKAYGSHMNAEKKDQAEIYIRDWLNTSISTNENGEYRLVLHNIVDPALLEELIKYNDDGNFDRVSALMIGMYHLQDLSAKRIAPKVTNKHSDFFDREFF